MVRVPVDANLGSILRIRFARKVSGNAIIIIIIIIILIIIKNIILTS